MYHQKKDIATNGNRLYGLLYSMLLLLIQVNGFSQGGSPSANIDQGNNGKLSAPNDPVVWINGNLNTTKSHYIESQSIPYRIKMDNLPIGVPITIRVGFDIRESGHYAIDYLTSYDWTSIHSFIFKHPDEVVDPELEMMAMFSGKVYAPLPNPGKKNSPTDWSTQPEASYNHVASQGKNQMTLINGTFVSNPSWVSGKEPDYSELNDKYEVQMDVTFVASAMPVIVAFGGHIASRYDWGTLPNLQARSAGGLPGSPYHMRIVDLRYNGTIKSIGSQDLSLQIDAPNCNNLALSIGSQQNLLCNGVGGGSVTLSTSGGNPGFQFSIDTGRTYQNSNVFSGLAPGDYQFLVRDTIGCVSPISTTIIQPPVILKSGKVTNVLCHGDKAGAIDLSVSGGTPGYTYAWSNGATSQDLSGVAAGTYTVTITDAGQCILKDTFQITQPSAALSVSGKSTDVLCYGDKTGSIDLSVSGGTKDYVYTWSNGESTEDIGGLSAGVYSVLVTDANGCEMRDTFTIKQPSSALSVGLEKVDVKCYGDASGSINLTVSGGTAPYAFSWSNGSTDEDLSALKAGVYHVLVTDDNGCEMRDTIAVSQPASGLALSGKIIDILCKGDQTGSIDITVSGGTPSYQFSWSSGEDTEDISGKAAGNYYVLITDANQCELKDTFEIEEPAEKLSVSGIVADLKCYNDGTGGIDITVSGGTMSYVYEWSTGAVTEDLTGIAAGTYTVTVTDKNGCSAKETFVVKQPEPLIVQADNNKVCAGKPIALTASPSVGTWTGTGVSGSEFMMPYAGTFNVVYTHTNLSGCKGIDTAQITVENCELDYCTYTQGYYGNAGGKSCSEGEQYSTLQLIQKALGKGTIVLGNPTFNKTFTIAYGDAATLISILPGGGSPTALSYTGNRTPSTLPSSMLKNGKINNVLLSQTITLALNVRINQGMDSFQLRSDKYLMTQDVVSCGSNDLKECSYHSYRLSEMVVNALNGNRTVSDLLKLANNALAGSLPMGVSYGDVAKAVDLLNNAYDGCRYGWYSDTVVYCADQNLYSSASNLTASEQPVQVNVEQGLRQPSVKAFPNPFDDMVRFTIESPENIQCNLMLYTASGKLISKVFDGRVEANVARTVQIMVPSIYRGAIMYVLSYNGQVVSGKILKK
jgi:hypothetical protein